MCCLCLFQGLVAGLLRPRPPLKQIEHSSSSGKFRERHTGVVAIVSLGSQEPWCDGKHKAGRVITLWMLIFSTLPSCGILFLTMLSGKRAMASLLCRLACESTLLVWTAGLIAPMNSCRVSHWCGHPSGSSCFCTGIVLAFSPVPLPLLRFPPTLPLLAASMGEGVCIGSVLRTSRASSLFCSRRSVTKVQNATSCPSGNTHAFLSPHRVFLLRGSAHVISSM